MEHPIDTQSINKLREQVREYDRLYRLGMPIVSDTEFDLLFRKLQQLESESGELIPSDSPTQRPGSDAAEGRKRVKHQVPMLSIENVYDIGELKNFGSRAQKILGVDIDSIGWIVELKVDGCGLSLIYDHGILTQGITRGKDGEGDDVTHNLDMIRDIPDRLKVPANKILSERLEVRGEVYMTNTNFDDLCEILYSELKSDLGHEPSEDEKKRFLYRNPRNLTTGTLGLKNTKDIDKEIKNETGIGKRNALQKEKEKTLKEHNRRKLHFLAHSVGSYKGAATTHWDFLQELQSYGISVTPHAKRFNSFEAAANYCEELYKTDDNFRSELDFEIDGLVLKLDRFDLREQLGETGHHPRWVIAYKVEKYEAVTTVREIRVQIGKTGTITPVAELQPVEIDRTTVSRASLHNAEEIERKDIRVGDTVVVEKAGKIIPHIVRVERHLRTQELSPFEFPVRCPACDTALTKDDGGVYIRCNNPLCPAQFKEKLKYFAGRNAMDIEGLGDKLIEQLVDEGFVKNFADLYRLKERRAELEKMGRQGEKSINNLLEEIEKSRTRALKFWINALSIRDVGGKVAGQLAKQFGTLKKIRRATESELCGVDGIGEVLAKHIAEFFRNESEKIDDLLQYCQHNTEALTDENESNALLFDKQPLSGLTIVVTGTLERFKRDEIENIIEQCGGKTSSSVSKKTSFVLVGENPGSKSAKAKQLGIRIVHEAEFLAMIE